MKTTKEIKEEDNYYKPISVDEHWNCGNCNCSHKYYFQAENCCEYKNDKWFSVSDVDKLREELKEIMLINYDAFHDNSSEMYDNNIKDIDEKFDNFKGDEK